MDSGSGQWWVGLWKGRKRAFRASTTKDIDRTRICSPCPRANLASIQKNKVRQGRCRRQGTRVPGRGGGAVSRASQAAKGWGFGICQVGTSLQELQEKGRSNAHCSDFQGAGETERSETIGSRKGQKQGPPLTGCTSVHAHRLVSCAHTLALIDAVGNALNP